MKMRKPLALLASLLLSLGIGAFTACEGVTVTPDGSVGMVVKPINPGDITVTPNSDGGVTIKPGTNSEESSSSSDTTLPEVSEEVDSPESDSGNSSENSSTVVPPETSEDSSTDSSDNSSSSSETPEPPVPPILEPKVPSTYIEFTSDITSYKPEGYGVKATLTETTYNSRQVIKGTFNNVGANTYPGEDGGKWVWTYVSIDLPTVNKGRSGDLRGSALSFELKTVNCSPISSIILYDENSNRSEEIPFNNQGDDPNAMFDVFEMLDGWYEFTINLPLIYEADVLDNVTSIDIVFSNAYGNNAVDSIFYLNNASFVPPTKAWTSPTVYNHEGYYETTDDLSVMFAGNSFIEFSKSAYWFNELCEMGGVAARAEYKWTPNGRISDQYDNAFDSDGYMMEGEKPDVIFIQDFYDLNDALKLGEFLEKTLETNPFTEVIVYAADNETTDGSLAAERYSIDLVDWRTAIHTLKKSYGFTTANLNYADGATHANELNGVFGATMAYMHLFGEVPNWEALMAVIEETNGRFGDEVKDFLPGATEVEKAKFLTDGLKLCATLNGLDPDDICFHNYVYEVVDETTCTQDGFVVGQCSNCDAEDSYTVPASGHSYVNGKCTACGEEFKGGDKDDLSTSQYLSTKIIDKWITHSNLVVQNEVISSGSTSALKGSFNAKDIDEPYDSAQDPNGDNGLWVWSVLTIDLVTLCNGYADLDTYTLWFDVKAENCDVTSSVMLLNSANKRSAQIPFNQSDKTLSATGPEYSGIYKTLLNNDWVRIEINLDEAFGNYDKSETKELYIIFSNAYGDYTKDAVFYIDNMWFKQSGYVETPTQVQADYLDLADPTYISTDHIGTWMVDANLELQKQVVSQDSSSALKGSFHLDMADEWYDSSQSADGDGGKWIWTTIAIDVTHLIGYPNVHLQGKKLSFDVKTVNCSPVTGLTILDANGAFPTEIGLNNTFNNAPASSLQGITKTMLTDGWVRITVELDKVFSADTLRNATKLVFIFSNAFGDYVNDSIFYLDEVTVSAW